MAAYDSLKTIMLTLKSAGFSLADIIGSFDDSYKSEVLASFFGPKLFTTVEEMPFIKLGFKITEKHSGKGKKVIKVNADFCATNLLEVMEESKQI